MEVLGRAQATGGMMGSRDFGGDCTIYIDLLINNFGLW